MADIDEWLLDRFQTDPDELARHDDADETHRLGLDMLARGQLQRVAAIETGRMIFGHGRYLAAKAVGIKTLEVNVYPAMSDTQFMLTRASENLQRKELTGYRRWRLCADLMCANPGWQQKDLAQQLNRDPSQITRLLSPSKLPGDWQEALKAGQVSTSDCYEASKKSPEALAGLLALKLAGEFTNRKQLAQAGRRAGNGKSESEPAPRTPKIKIPLAVNTKDISVNGMATVAGLPGEEISLEDAESILTQAAKAVREAIRDGLDAKTFQAVARSRAKAG